jgi:hypothetical protein
MSLIYSRNSSVTMIKVFKLLFFVGLEFELRASCLQSRHSYHFNHASSSLDTWFWRLGRGSPITSYLPSLASNIIPHDLSLPNSYLFPLSFHDSYSLAIYFTSVQMGFTTLYNHLNNKQCSSQHCYLNGRGMCTNKPSFLLYQSSN